MKKKSTTGISFHDLVHKLATQGTSCDARDNPKRGWEGTRNQTRTDFIRTNGFAKAAVSTDARDMI